MGTDYVRSVTDMRYFWILILLAGSVMAQDTATPTPTLTNTVTHTPTITRTPGYNWMYIPDLKLGKYKTADQIPLTCVEPANTPTPAYTVTDNAVARFDGTSASVVQGSGVSLDDNDNMVFPGGAYLGIDEIRAQAVTNRLVYRDPLGSPYPSVDVGNPGDMLNLYGLNVTITSNHAKVINDNAYFEFHKTADWTDPEWFRCSTPGGIPVITAQIETQGGGLDFVGLMLQDLSGFNALKCDVDDGFIVCDATGTTVTVLDRAGDIWLYSGTVRNLPAPQTPTDAANKAYVDAQSTAFPTPIIYDTHTPVPTATPNETIPAIQTMEAQAQQTIQAHATEYANLMVTATWIPGTYVNVAGDTMSGALTLTNTGTALTITGGASIAKDVYAKNLRSISGFPMIYNYLADMSTEGGKLYLGGLENDLAYLRQRGKNCTFSNGYLSWDACFNAQPDYTIPGSFGGAPLTIDVELTKSFIFRFKYGISFGATTWACRDMTFQFWSSGEWKTASVVTGWTNEIYQSSADYGIAGAVSMRVILDNEANPGNTRISELWCIAYNSTSLKEGFLGRDGGDVWGPVSMNLYSIAEVPTPSSPTDAANKKYVDDSISGIATHTPVPTATPNETIPAVQTIEAQIQQTIVAHATEYAALVSTATWIPGTYVNVAGDTMLGALTMGSYQMFSQGATNVALLATDNAIYGGNFEDFGIYNYLGDIDFSAGAAKGLHIDNSGYVSSPWPFLSASVSTGPVTATTGNFSDQVTVPTPSADGSAVNKAYVTSLFTYDCTPTPVIPVAGVTLIYRCGVNTGVNP
ncbi:MAG: hypothetical protein WC433_01890 [Candidatus Omnitrophota bacterium]